MRTKTTTMMMRKRMRMMMTMAMKMTITMIVIMIGCWSFTSPLDQNTSKGFPSHQGMCTSSATSLTQCPTLTHTECPSHTVSQPLTGGGKSTIRYQHHQNFYLNELQCSEFLVHSKRTTIMVVVMMLMATTRTTMMTTTI